jgi:hypothetical protein
MRALRLIWYILYWLKARPLAKVEVLPIFNRRGTAVHIT